MPRNMSFMLTTDQIRNKTKTVTRRVGWEFLKPGDVLNACVKCQGLKKGEKVERICQIRVLSVREEPLTAITHDEVKKEGFPNLGTWTFVAMFCREMKVDITVKVNRIEFEYLPEREMNHGENG